MNEPSTNQPLTESLGAELRKQREIREISLKEIADATKISRRYLEALETDDHQILPAPVFTRGFVREFARYIGLDPEEMADRYNEVAGVEPGGGGSDEQVQSQPLPFVRIDRNLVVFAVLLLSFTVVVWWVWSHMGSTVDEPVAKPAIDTIESAVAPVVVERSEPVETETPPVAVPEQLELRVTVLDDTWVILRVDGVQETNEVLRAGEVRSFAANEEFRFEVVGNAGGISLALNGKPLPSLGDRGRVVRNLVYDWDYLDTLQEEATPDDA